jgi:hypothetical protein
VRNGVFRPKLSVVGIPVSDCDNNMYTLHGSLDRICGFYGATMSSNHATMTRERVRVSIACKMVCLDWNRRLSEYRYQYGEFEDHKIFESSDRFTTPIQA